MTLERWYTMIAWLQLTIGILMRLLTPKAPYEMATYSVALACFWMLAAIKSRKP